MQLAAHWQHSLETVWVRLLYIPLKPAGIKAEKCTWSGCHVWQHVGVTDRETLPLAKKRIVVQPCAAVSLSTAWHLWV